jgi:hypothetical protein
VLLRFSERNSNRLETEEGISFGNALISNDESTFVIVIVIVVVEVGDGGRSFTRVHDLRSFFFFPFTDPLKLGHCGLPWCFQSALLRSRENFGYIVKAESSCERLSSSAGMRFSEVVIV